MKINTDFYVCLGCKSDKLTTTDSHIICSNCEKKYPLIDGEIPVLLTNSARLITQTYQEYARFFESQKNENRLLQNVDHPYRDSSEIEKLISAKQHNAEILSSLKNSLKPFIDPDQLTSNQATSDFRYLVNWEYLRRDWSNESSGLHEIKTITEHIRKELTDDQENGNAVILGAGAGRLVYELSENHKSVFALDNMFTMVGLYHQVLQKDIPFFEINEKNILKNADRSVKKVAKSPPSKSNVHPENYFWGDASQLPFAKESIERVYSIYFTDVLPLKVLLKEVNRVLKSGGDFVHYGPLFYHFSNPSDMLSAEEVVAAFESNGFEIIFKTTSELYHHKSEVSMMHRVYNNWSFIARKQKNTSVEMTNDTVYRIDKGLNYEAHGTISPTSTDLEFDLKMTVPDGTKYATTELILECIRRADGQRTLGKIIQTIEEEYNHALPYKDQEELREILVTLVDKKVIKIVH